MTHHGNESHVLLDISDYRRLTTAGIIETIDPLPTVREFMNWMEYGVIVVDDDLRVLLMNQPSIALLRQRDALPEHTILLDAFPELRGTLVESYLRRAISTGERNVVDFPSILRPNRWTRLTLLPSAAGSTTLIFRDITEDVEMHRLADIKIAIVEAMTRHGGIGYARIDPRGRISKIDQPLVELVGLPENRLIGCAFADLIPASQRMLFRDTVDAVMTHGGSAKFRTAVLTNTGAVVAIDGAAAQLRGLYGIEGVVLVATPST